MPQITIPLPNFPKLPSIPPLKMPAVQMPNLQGNRTYILLAIGAVVIVANHFGYLPADLTPQNLDPKHWITDLFGLALGAAYRAALGDNYPDPKTTAPGGADYGGIDKV